MKPFTDRFPHEETRTEETSGPAPIGPERPTPPDEQSVHVWEALTQVIDPEIGIDIVTLGLVYGVEVIENAVRVTYTLTTPGCPMEAVIRNGIVAVVSALPGVDDVLPNLVWEPHWHSGMIGEQVW